MNNQRPSLFRIIAIDYIAFLTILFPIVFWVSIFTNSPNPDPTMLYIAIGVTATTVLVFLWRVYHFIKMFDTGVETPAIIQRVLYSRSRGRVEYTFDFQGTQFTAHDLVLKATGVRDIAIGLQVTALVNANNPQKAIIKDLYAKR